MTMIFFFPIQSSSFQGFEDQPLFQRQNFFPETFANLIVAFQLFLFRCCICIFFFPRLCMRSHPVSHTPSHARSQAHTTHPSILSHMRHAQPDSWPRPPGGEDGALSGRFSLEEMNLAPQH